MIDNIGNLELIGRLGVALGCGLALGLEREVRAKVAGMRTHAIVALGAALFTIAGAAGVETAELDPTRVAAQVVTGIGFIGAGAIMRSGFTVSGITTASTLWLAGALGVAAGFGLTVVAVAALAMGLSLVALLGPVMSKLPLNRTHRVEVSYHSGHGTLVPLFAGFGESGLVVREMKLDEKEDGVRHAQLTVSGAGPDAVAEVLMAMSLRNEVITTSTSSA